MRDPTTPSSWQPHCVSLSAFGHVFAPILDPYVRIMEARMRKTTIDMNEEVFAKARKRASAANMSLDEYIAFLVLRDVDGDASGGDQEVDLIAPDDVREYRTASIPGESPEGFEFRAKIFASLLDQARR